MVLHQQVAANIKTLSQKFVVGVTALASIIILSAPAVAGATPNINSTNSPTNQNSTQQKKNDDKNKNKGHDKDDNKDQGHHGRGHHDKDDDDNDGGYGGHHDNRGNLTINANASNGGIINIVVNYFFGRH